MLTNETDYSPSNQTDHNGMPTDLLIIGTFCYSLVFLIGIVGNLLVLYVLSIEKDLRNFTNYLLANLSIADSLTLVICIPVGLHDLYAKERWYLGAVSCYLIVFIESSLGVASILSIFFITLERFYVICRPLDVKSLMTQSRTLKLIIFIWLSAFVINFPFIHLAEYQLSNFNDNTQGYECLLKSDDQMPKIYIVSVSFLIYFLIGIVLIYMYTKIFTQLNKSTLYVFSFSNESKSSFSLIRREYSLSKSSSLDGPSKKAQAQSAIQPPATQQQQFSDRNQSTRRKTGFYKTSQGELIMFRKKNMSDRTRHVNNSLVKYIRLRRKLICMLIIVVVAFYICLFPLKIWNLIYMFLGYRPEFREVVTLRVFWTINIIVRTFFYINSSLNPILYNWLSAKFRYNFKKLLIFSKKSTESQICHF